jgi:hypothetical protein
MVQYPRLVSLGWGSKFCTWTNFQGDADSRISW